MGSLRDLTGQVFGRLTVLRRAENIKKRTRWHCVCVCGNEMATDAYSLYKGLSTSCGCFSAECTSARKLKDMTGLRVGMLVVLRRSGTLNKTIPLWECACDCGNTTTVRYVNLKYSQVTDCGCRPKRTTEKKRKACVRNGKANGIKNSGKNSHLYKPELTDEDRLAKRNFVELREWRKAVFTRDDYTCDICGQRGGKIEAHHLNDWANHKQERFLMDNGVTLCRKHHKEFHYKMGTRGKCKRADFEEFRLAYLQRELQLIESFEKEVSE